MNHLSEYQSIILDIHAILALYISEAIQNIMFFQSEYMKCVTSSTDERMCLPPTSLARTESKISCFLPIHSHQLELVLIKVMNRLKMTHRPKKTQCPCLEWHHRPSRWWVGTLSRAFFSDHETYLITLRSGSSHWRVKCGLTFVDVVWLCITSSMDCYMLSPLDGVMSSLRTWAELINETIGTYVVSHKSFTSS